MEIYKSERLIDNVIQVPDAFLNEPTKPIPFNMDEKEILQMHKHMSGILDGTSNGIALAANQAGIKYSIFVHRLEGDYRSVINPHITMVDGVGLAPIATPEGCLSLPKGMYFQQGIERLPELWVTYWEYPGLTRITRKVKNFEAQMFQHEIDHLNGYTLINRPAHYLAQYDVNQSS